MSNLGKLLYASKRLQLRMHNRYFGYDVGVEMADVFEGVQVSIGDGYLRVRGIRKPIDFVHNS